MTKKEAKKEGFTHVGKIYKIIKIYIKDIDSLEPEIVGINLIYDSLLMLISTLDTLFNLSDSFSIEIIENI